MSLGQNINNIRVSQGKTLEELSSECNLSWEYLSKIERDVAFPSQKALQKIATAFGCQVSDLYIQTLEFPDDELLNEINLLLKTISEKQKKLVLNIVKCIKHESS